MKQIVRPSGVLTLPDHVTLYAPGAPTRAVRRRGVRLPTGPIPVDSTVPMADAEDPIVRAMLDQDLVLVDEFSLLRAAAPAKRAAPEPTRGAWDVRADEDAVVLLESDGVYSWRYGKEVAPVKPRATRRGSFVVPAVRRVEFDLGSTATGAPSGGGSTKSRRARSPLTDMVVGQVRGWVFRFIARFAAEKVVAALERKHRTGLVWMQGADPLAWKPIDALRDVPLPADRTPRVLLFVHGTFSSTLGSFGHLGATVWGQAFLEDAVARYDAIIGFDHLTLSEDPLQNATHLLNGLENSPVSALDIDAISFSRGGLVLRSLIEYLLPGARLRARVRRAVFVAATNNGTELATAENWKHLVDLTTNLVTASARAIAFFAPPAALVSTIVSQAVGSLGALVKALATAVLEEKHAPGLAAMVPAGAFVVNINKTQPGQPTAAESMYYAITSDFDVKGVKDGGAELPKGLVKWLADVVVDAEMKGVANDLVVNNASTITIDSGASAFIKDHKHFEKNPAIYHTVFFTRKEVAESLARWLEFEPRAVTSTRSSLPSGANPSIAVVETTMPLNAAIAMIDRAAPEYVVARRVAGTEVYHYAFRPEELTAVLRKHADIGPKAIEAALANTDLRLGEDSSSDELRGSQRRGSYGSRGLTTERTVVLEGKDIRGVIDIAGGTRSTAALGEMHTAAVAARRGVPKMQALPPALPKTRSASTRRAAAPKPLAPAAPPPATPITVYASADTTEAIPLGAVVPLNVLVSRDEIIIMEGPARKAGSTKVAADRPLVVQVVPKSNLEIVGDARAEVDPAQPESRLIFDIKGAAVGEAEVWVILRQGVRVLLTLILKPTVIAKSKEASKATTHDAGFVPDAPPDTHEYPVLQIFENEIGKQVRYQFLLHMNDREYFSDYSKPLKVSQDQYVADIYKKIEDFWISKPGDVAAFTVRLRVLGGTLLDALVPASIQKALWDSRDKIVAIQVVAEEPFIPWELVHLKEPSAPGQPRKALPKESHFLGQKGLVRWLHNRGPMPTSVRVRDGRSRYVIPVYPTGYELPEAQKEIPYLKKAFGSTPVVPIDVTTIQTLLMEPGIDHFHFSGHGEADAQKAAIDAHLLLSMDQEGHQLIPRYLPADVIGETASLVGPDGNRPLVVLNACQIGRASWRLTSIGGFAESFISRGAAIFVGSLWSVGDAPARNFSEAFYKALLAGKPLAEAATVGRESARNYKDSAGNPGDATWMAYVVYGYPYAIVTRE